MKIKDFVHACYCVNALRLRGVCIRSHAATNITGIVLYPKEPQFEIFCHTLNMSHAHSWFQPVYAHPHYRRKHCSQCIQGTPTTEGSRVPRVDPSV